MSTIPPWIRALLAVDRVVHSSVRLAALVRSEVLLAGADAATRHAVNAQVFSAEDTYTPGGPAFAQGLFDWERDALAHPAFPAAGRVLLGGAGGGRELVALCDAGYAVDAFEPAPGLYDALAAVASQRSGVRTFAAGYGELIDAVVHGHGPLAALRATRYDAVVLGWASVTHLTDDRELRALLAALRSLAPTAPVLLSYLGPDDDGRANGRVEALRRPLRSALARVTGRHVAEGEGFAPGAGFYRRFAPAQMEALAAEAGYRCALHRVQPYPHALLVPRGEEIRTGDR